jgi:hypothetical protein
MAGWKLAGWFALLIAVIGGSAWRITTCSCFPPTNPSQWNSILIKSALALLASVLIVWDIVTQLKSSRVPR